MTIREVKVSELLEFVESEQFMHFDIKPVSVLRAISQFNNPAAFSNDIALVYIADGNQMLAFAGLLPDRLTDQTALSCNTGWWVAPGRNYLALPVFLKALEKCGNLMFFTDCSTHTKSILEKTGLFEFQPEIKGKRFFLRSCFGPVLRRKKKNKMLVMLAGLADLAFNLLFNFLTYSLWRRIRREGFSIQEVTELDSAIDEFIAANTGDHVLAQSTQKMNWILKNPWIKTGAAVDDSAYPFSNNVDSFSQQFMVIKRQNEIVAVFIINIINGMASIPYIFFRKQNLTEISNQIRLFLKLKNAESLAVFNEDLQNAISGNGIPVLFAKRISRFAGFSLPLKEKFSKNRYFQDGDGDVAFT